VSGRAARRRISAASAARSGRPAPSAAAASKIASASPRQPSGSWSVQPQTARAHDGDSSPPASAPATAGCADSRRIHAIAVAAAVLVTRVCHASQLFADP